MTKAERIQAEHMATEMEKRQWAIRMEDEVRDVQDRLTSLDSKVQIIADSQSQTNNLIRTLVKQVEENTALTKDVLAVANVARKVGLFGRLVGSFVSAKAVIGAKMARWLSFNVIRPIGFAAAGVVAIYTAYLQLPWAVWWIQIKQSIAEWFN